MIISLEQMQIQKGFSQLKRWKMSSTPTYMKAQTRQISDWLVGYQFYPACNTFLWREKGIN